MKPLIRAERPADAQAIDELIREAFQSAPHSDQTEHAIVDALRQSAALTISLVAEQDGAVVGYVAISPVAVSDHSTGWFGLGPIAVLPALQAKGIGSALMRESLARLRDTGAGGCVVLGEPEYYGRFGFASEPGLRLPNVPAEYFQVIAFTAAPLPVGEVRYHPAFGATA